AAAGTVLFGLSFYLLDGAPAFWPLPSIAFGGAVDTGLLLAALAAPLALGPALSWLRRREPERGDPHRCRRSPSVHIIHAPQPGEQTSGMPRCKIVAVQNRSAAQELQEVQEVQEVQGSSIPHSFAPVRVKYQGAPCRHLHVNDECA